jgi:HEAT repeat protein
MRIGKIRLKSRTARLARAALVAIPVFACQLRSDQAYAQSTDSGGSHFISGAVGPNSIDTVNHLCVDLSAPSPSVASERQSLLQMTIRGLEGIDQLHRAFVLHEWRDLDVAEPIARCDQACRSFLAHRLETEVRETLRKGDTLNRLAIVSMLGEMGASTRAVGSRTSYTRIFTNDLCPLTTDDNHELRAAAARALGLINPEPDRAVAALDRMLSGAERSDKLAAADALINLLRTMVELTAQGRSPTSVEASRADLVKTGCAVVPLAARALGDADATVRHKSAEALHLASETLQKLAVVQRSPDAMEDLGVAQRQLEEDRFEVLGLVMALKDQAAALTHALADSDADVRLLARRTLEDIANPQIQLLQQVGEEARHNPVGNGKIPVRLTSLATQKTLQDGLKDMALALADAISDPDPRARRAALDVLETLGAAAAPAGPALVGALNDDDHFVRWAAARTLGKISPVEAETAVPVLVRLLDDADTDLNQAATAALERYGQSAKAALPDLIRIMGAGDPYRRVAAIHALPAIDGPDVYLSIPALTTLLRDRSPLVRCAAAETLGKFGPSARGEAADPLARALKDKNADVRRAADQALLNILRAGQR